MAGRLALQKLKMWGVPRKGNGRDKVPFCRFGTWLPWEKNWKLRNKN